MLGFAHGTTGIPFYDNVILWCNNAATWWPDIPVAIAIVVATCVMGAVCWDVYKKENASKKWRGANARNELSGKVFWQSFWFLMAFYGTWPPYLALQYAWASGAAFSHYGFILFAGIVVPLQGFLEFLRLRPHEVLEEGPIQASHIFIVGDAASWIFLFQPKKKVQVKREGNWFGSIQE